MKKLLVVLALFCSFSVVSADIYKDELKKTEKDRKKVEEIEKKLSTDEKDCENPSEKSSDRSVVTELKIYCEARKSLKSRIPEMKRLLAGYEKLFREYSEQCKKIDSDEKYEKCAETDRKVGASAEVLNDEKEKFDSDIDNLENAAARAKELNERNNDANKEDFKRTVSNNLQAKKELVTGMQKGLENDKSAFQNSKKQLNQALKNNTGESAAKGKIFMEGLNKILLQNGALLNLCSSMLRTISEANGVCIAKTDLEKCHASETKLENLFNDGNEKLSVYKNEKNDLLAMESDYHKAGMGDVLIKMENAKKTISTYLQNLKSQNEYLKQQIEASKNNMEVVKGRNNKKLTDTYTGHVATMKELERESGEFIKIYEDNLGKIESFTNSCVNGKSEFTPECRIEGDKIVGNINETEPKVIKYGEKFNKLNKDLADFYKKFQ
ncbi:hypothetical protein J6Z19_04855 [bacterium]|nr:hypothetical protein [bacterium]